ncbi:MAG: asparagine synthase-related protein [Acidobacteriota bacterium]
MVSLAAPKPIARLIDLVEPASQELLDMEVEEARRRVLEGAPEEVLAIRGSFALVGRSGERVKLARSLDRPLRYFLAKEEAGPMLVVAETMREILDFLTAEGYEKQFHPTYCRMVPAHHVMELQLVGCPDPNPVCRRFFDPPRAVLPADLDAIGERYVSALYQETRDWLARVPEDEPLGVAFSGGIDSGSVFLTIYRALLDAGQSPARLKAFVLAVDGGGEDVEQAREFLRRLDLELFLETIEVSAEELDPLEAVALIEDYKPLDVECAVMGLNLARGIRRRYPEWRYLIDGDGGDENLKDYPIEDNEELTIRSVVNNSMLYQEGWGVEAIKHSLTYSGGFSRACVRTWAPARRHGFRSFSPFTRPAVIAVAEAIPFAELTGGSHAALYDLKGEVMARGMRSVLGFELPVFPKRRFQHGAASAETAASAFAVEPARYRSHLLESFGVEAR